MSRSDGPNRHICVVGVQWGDEGKGKVVDVLTAEADVVVRYQGGANAGHTVQAEGKQYVLHLIPSGILQEGRRCVVGNGVVVDPIALVTELDQLGDSGLRREESLYISDRAHVVLPYHGQLDAVKEKVSGAGKIGTTLRGIGPAYADKATRLGIRMGDFVDPERFERLLRRNIEQKSRELRELYAEEIRGAEDVLAEYLPYARRLAPRVCDISELLWEEDRRGSRLLFEGAQGVLLDIDHGTYPFVTSSNTSFLGLGAGTGFSPRRVGTVLGVAKAYTTRVGSGPFPTELTDDRGRALRDRGGEYGATTGRERRCGWLDLVALRRTVRVGDVDALVITKLDVLDEFDEISVAVAYERGGERLERFPTSLEDGLRPVYHTLPGWKRSTRECRRLEELPAETMAYLQFVANATECPIGWVSVGKDRSEMIRIDPPLPPASPPGGRG